MRPGRRSVFVHRLGKSIGETARDVRLLRPAPCALHACRVDIAAGGQQAADEIAEASPEQIVSTLFQEMAPQVRRWATYRHGPEAGDEIVAATFLVVWRRADALSNSPAERRAWVFGVAHNVARELLRDRSLAEREPNNLRWPAVPVADPATLAAESDRVRDLLAGLPPAEREAFALFALADLSPSTIAQIEGTTAVAIRARLSRARRRLRTQLDADGATASEGRDR